MAVNRRDFIKIGAAAGAAALMGWYVNRTNERTIGPRQVPGSGQDGHFTSAQLDSIDVGAYLGACARCGVCVAECPFNAIVSEGWQLPQLNDKTRFKCPGYDICGVCYAVCPTSALSQAYKPLVDQGIKSGVEKAPWWEGQKIDKTIIQRPEVDESTEGGG